MVVLDLKKRPTWRLIGPTLLVLGVCLFVAWLGGLIWFVGQVPASVEDSTTRADAIVVLTGGSGRLRTGLELLSQNKGEKLFVSGVYRGVDVKTLLAQWQRAPTELENLVSIGDATNTAGNATETAEWINGLGYRSLRLVTASYHMPRSLLEFRHALPDTTLIPHPVFSGNVKMERWWAWPGTTALVAREFTKYLLAWARLKTLRLVSGGDAS